MKIEKIKEFEVLTVHLVVFALVYFSAQVVFGQDVAPVIVEPVVPTWQAKIEMILKQLESPWLISAALLSIEFVMRFVKTSDPKSLLYVIANGFKLFARLFEKFASILDK